MRPERLLVAVVVVAGLALAAASCGGGGERPYRIGVIVDCTGLNRALEGPELSGAALPLLARGARLRGHGAVGGVTSATVAGRPVELVRGCTEVLEFSTLTEEVRRLAEVEHVDAIVAGTSGADEIVLRDAARRHPGVLFVAVAHGPREVTLDRPAPNLFRVAADHDQGVAGLATYAYRRLGWRRAAVVLTAWDEGWGARDAFVGEFCALGGRVVQQLGVASFDPSGADAEQVRRDVDGVAVLSSNLLGPDTFLRRLARRVGEPARRLLVGPGIAGDPALLAAAGPSLRGVVGSSYLPAPGDTGGHGLEEYLGDHARAFPDAPAGLASSALVSGYRDAMEALLVSLGGAGGSPARVAAELARLDAPLLAGRTRLDGRRQAIAPTWLVRVGAPSRRGGTPALAAIATVPAVDQSVGGLIAPSQVPGDRPAACRRAPAPPWSR